MVESKFTLNLSPRKRESIFSIKWKLRHSRAIFIHSLILKNLWFQLIESLEALRLFLILVTNADYVQSIWSSWQVCWTYHLLMCIPRYERQSDKQGMSSFLMRGVTLGNKVPEELKGLLIEIRSRFHDIVSKLKLECNFNWYM